MSDMVIGYDAKRAFCNRTGLGNYSRGVIAGVFSAYDTQNIVVEGLRVY